MQARDGKHTYTFDELKNVIGSMGIWAIYEGSSQVAEMERVGTKFVVVSNLTRLKHTIDVSLVRRQQDALDWAAKCVRDTNEVDESRKGIR